MKDLYAVICCINSKYVHSSLAPWCLYAGVKKYCKQNIKAAVEEGTINENMLEIQKRLVRQKPDVIGFCCYIWNIKTVVSVAKAVKAELPDTIIVLGGPEVSYNAKNVLSNNSFVDFVVSGEGEKSFAALLNHILDNEHAPCIDGVCCKTDEGVYVSLPAILCEDPVSPYCNEFFNKLNGRIAYLETSRGCPYSCAFCLSGRCGKVRFFDIERAKKDIVMLANSTAQTIKLVDRTFNANKSRAKEIFKFIIDNYDGKIPKGVCFHFEIAGDILDEETINILTSAPVGLIQLEIGMQSFNEKTLEFINRKTNTHRLKSNITTLVKAHNMHIHIDLIAGLPYEDLPSFKKSFNTAFFLNANMLQMGFLKLLYGAPMRELPDKYPCSFNALPPYEVIETPWIGADELKRLHCVEDALDRIYNSGRFRRSLAYALEQSKMQPYDFFEGFAQYVKGETIQNIPLDEYTKLLLNYILTLNNISGKVLRDKMVCDRLSTNASGKIPKCLQVSDERMKKYKKYILQNTKSYGGTKMGIAILYTQNSVVYTNYSSKNISSGEYTLNYLNFKNVVLE